MLSPTQSPALDSISRKTRSMPRNRQSCKSIRIWGRLCFATCNTTPMQTMLNVKIARKIKNQDLADEFRRWCISLSISSRPMLCPSRTSISFRAILIKTGLTEAYASSRFFSEASRLNVRLGCRREDTTEDISISSLTSRPGSSAFMTIILRASSISG